MSVNAAVIDLSTAPDAPRPEHPVRRPNRVEKTAILFFVVFLLIFPKGGIKLGSVPLTWGYLGIGAYLLWFLPGLLAGRAARVPPARLLVLGLLVPFQLVSWLALLSNGVSGVGFTLSFLVTFFAVPAISILAFGVHLDRIDLGFLLRAVRLGVLVVAAYGIFLFFYKLLTGSFIEIPLLTVNLGDIGALEDKSINRGGIFKLISTYNNGNIYGISMLMLLPLYAWMEPRLSRRLIVKASLILTLSRTVWVGLIAYEVLQRLYVKRVSFRTLFILLAWILLAALGIWYALELLDVGMKFLFDRKLGGRIEQLEVLGEATILPQAEFETIVEMVYLSVLHNFGMIGLASFLAGMAGPLLLYVLGTLPLAGTEYKKSLAVGLAVYLFVSLSDGAILYIPVMSIYWFVASLLLSDNPSFADMAAGGEVQRT